jgi:hypothetical protein
MHEQDGFQEKIPWGLLRTNYHVEPLPKESEGNLQQVLWTCQLQDVGSAGLKFVPCTEGFLVQSIDSQPRQQYMAAGDVIVAIGDSLLGDLQPHEAEKCFEESCQDGVLVVVGHHAELTKYDVAQVKKATLKIISKCLGSIKASDDSSQGRADVRLDRGPCGDESPPQKYAEENRLDLQPLPVPGLMDVLHDALVFTKYGSKARQWCDENGAVDLEEILDFVEDFSDALGFKPLERKRFLKALHAHNVAVDTNAAALGA